MKIKFSHGPSVKISSPKVEEVILERPELKETDMQRSLVIDERKGPVQQDYARSARDSGMRVNNIQEVMKAKIEAERMRWAYRI